MVAGLFQVSDPVNEVHIDAAALQAEAAAVASEFPADLPADPGAELQPAVSEDAKKGYQILAGALVGQGALIFVPAWDVSPAECTDLADAIVEALLLWFPDGVIPPKYMAILAVLGVGFRIAYARRDPSTGAFKPRHVKPAATVEKSSAHASS